MRVLVTGGAGFIGSHTVEELLVRDHEVRILDNLQKPVHLKGKPRYIPQNAEFIFGDVRDKRTMEYALTGVEAVYHFAAYQDYLPDFSTYFHVNSVSTALIYEVIVEKKLPVKKVIVASSQAVMGEGKYKCLKCEVERLKDKGKSSPREIEKQEEQLIDAENSIKTDMSISDNIIISQGKKDKRKEKREDSGGAKLEEWECIPDIRVEEQLVKGEWEHRCPRCGKVMHWQRSSELVIKPQNQYAMSKYAQEMIAINLGRRYNIPSVAMRYSIVQGPRQSFYNAYSGACRIFSLNLFFNRAPTIYEDGRQVRDYVNIDDVVRANILVLEKAEADFQVFNVGGGKPYTVLEFYDIVRQVFERDIEPSLSGYYRYGDTRHIFSDISKLCALGWEPQHSPEKSVRDYRQYLEEQTDIEDILAYAEQQMKEKDVIRRMKVER